MKYAIITVLSFAMMYSQTASAQNEPVSISTKVTNTVKVQSYGRVQATKIDSLAVSLSSQGADSSQCQTYGRRSNAGAHAESKIISESPLSLSFSLDTGAFAQGGHFRTCGSCLANLCVGIRGNDTRATSKAEASVVTTITFDSNYDKPNDYILNVSTSLTGDKLKIKLLEGNGNELRIKQDNGDPTVLRGKPGAVYYIMTALSSDATDEGGCCEARQDSDAKIDIQLTKAPILFTGYLTGYIRGGNQTSGYKNVGAIVLDGRVHCSGTVVGSYTVLTAAHCVYGYESQKDKMKFILGSNFQFPEQTPSSISKWFYPDGSEPPFKFNSQTYEDDIAVIHLVEKINVSAAKIYTGSPSWNEILGNRMSLLFVGFGFNVIEGEKKGIGVKREGQWEISSVENRRILFKVPGMNTCYGDSGGPAFVERNSEIFLAAITSGGNEDCTHGVETRIDAYTSWLDGKII